MPLIAILYATVCSSVESNIVVHVFEVWDFGVFLFDDFGVLLFDHVWVFFLMVWRMCFDDLFGEKNVENKSKKKDI